MKAIIFDFDGTIADSFEQVLAFLCGQAKRDPQAISSEDRRRLRDLSMKDLAMHVGVPAWKLPIVFLRGKARLTKHVRKTPLFPGMEQVLRTMHGEKYQLYIMSSNSKRNIQSFLQQHGLSMYFTRVYGNTGWFSKGPALKKVMQLHKLDAKTTVYVGDEIRDIVGAHEAGMSSIVVTWGFGSEAGLLAHNPTLIARNPAQLKKILVDRSKIV